MQETKVMPRQTKQSTSICQDSSLTIHVPNTVHNPCGMSTSAKKKAQENGPAMAALFEQTLQDKGAYDSDRISWVSPEEVEVAGLSQAALHSFILKAEQLGKTVTLTKTVTVKVS